MKNDFNTIQVQCIKSDLTDEKFIDRVHSERIYGIYVSVDYLFFLISECYECFDLRIIRHDVLKIYYSEFESEIIYRRSINIDDFKEKLGVLNDKLVGGMDKRENTKECLLLVSELIKI